MFFATRCLGYFIIQQHGIWRILSQNTYPLDGSTKSFLTQFTWWWRLTRFMDEPLKYTRVVIPDASFSMPGRPPTGLMHFSTSIIVKLESTSSFPHVHQIRSPVSAYSRSGETSNMRNSYYFTNQIQQSSLF